VQANPQKQVLSKGGERDKPSTAIAGMEVSPEVQDLKKANQKLLDRRGKALKTIEEQKAQKEEYEKELKEVEGKLDVVRTRYGRTGGVARRRALTNSTCASLAGTTILRRTRLWRVRTGS
jgi:hypothetical protein